MQKKNDPTCDNQNSKACLTVYSLSVGFYSGSQIIIMFVNCRWVFINSFMIVIYNIYMDLLSVTRRHVDVTATRLMFKYVWLLECCAAF